MPIPQTRRVDIPGIELHHTENELFSFCFEQLQRPAYLEEFIRSLDVYLPAFVFSRTTLKRQQDLLAAGRTHKTPLERARDALKKTALDHVQSSGELGELLLYLFAKEIMGAQKLISKIQSRASAEMSVHGRDGIFLWLDDVGNVYMLTGEAKLKPDGNDGLREAQADSNDFWASGKIAHEVHLASDHLRDDLTEENANLYETYFIDDNEDHSRLKYKNIIFVGYNCQHLQSLKDGSMNDNQFEHSMRTDLERCFSNQEELIKASTYPSVYCFLPLECVNTARLTFAQHNNLIR